MNKRFRELSSDLSVERIATEIHIFYDPLTLGATIVFQGEEYILDRHGGLVAKLDGREALSVGMFDLTGLEFDGGEDPDTGADLGRVSVLGLGNLLRSVYDVLANRDPEDAD